MFIRVSSRWDWQGGAPDRAPLGGARLQTVTTAARLYAGYKLKAISLIAFVTIGLGLIMLAFDLLFNSFNAFFDRHADYFLPRYMVARKAGIDLIESNYSIADLALKEGDRAALAAALGRDFEVQDVSYFYAMFQYRRNPDRRFYALVIGVDFDAIDRIFPYFKDKISPEQKARYKKEALVMADSEMAGWRSVMRGDSLTLLSTDYFQDYNGIKVAVGDIQRTPMKDDDSMGVPVVYIDLSHIRRLLAMPVGIGLPLVLVPKRPAHAISLGDALNMARIREAATARGIAAFSVVTVSTNLYKTYSLYSSLLIFFSAFLVVIMVAAISAMLSINFQNRKADFGLMKAFGCSNRRLLGFLVCENAIGLAIPLCLAIAANVAAGAAVKPFKVVSSFVVSPRASAAGTVIVALSAALICAVSSIKPYRFLKRIDPVEILREE
jgi:ABC-type lipoprotein release transport system permease subunit